MPEMTGFEVARQLGQNGNCFVIFVTSHQELVYDSFNFRPLNFICKDPDADVMKDSRTVDGRIEAGKDSGFGE